ncbi:hypothetical protein MAHJHV35_47940 [Mycobacterium avium subsp. hominissuis]
MLGPVLFQSPAMGPQRRQRAHRRALEQHRPQHRLPGIFRPVQAVLGPVLFQSPAMGALLEEAVRTVVLRALHGRIGGGPQRRLWAVSEELTGVHFPV